ncbi:MAG: DDE transposase, partial [Candidatus Aureabacteria bacterium]|nr:DDE transposase [Candidatus Auribacterota bacterium]
AWQRSYDRRTAAERVNSRLDVSFGFERHFIRGLAKMRLRVDIAMVVMLTMALGRIRQKRSKEMRSLVGRARAA